jgi:hypothetical protein
MLAGYRLEIRIYRDMAMSIIGQFFNRLLDKTDGVSVRVSSNALLFNSVLVLFALLTSFCGGVHLIDHDPWTQASQNLANNIISGSGPIMTIDPLVSDKLLHGMIWPGPIAVLWSLIWIVLKLPFMNSVFISIVTLILTSSIARRLTREAALIVGLMCAFYPDLLIFAHREPQILLAINLVMASTLCLLSHANGRCRTASAILFAMAAISVHPLAIPFCLASVFCFLQKRFWKMIALLFALSMILIFILALLLRLQLLNSYLQCLHFGFFPWRNLHKHVFSFWIIFVSSPMSYFYLILAFHAIRNHKNHADGVVIVAQALHALLGLLLFSIIYLSHKNTTLTIYIVPAYVFALPLVGQGYHLALSQINASKPHRTRRMLALTMLTVVYFIGIGSLESQLMNAIVMHDKVANKDSFLTPYKNLRSMLSPDQWIFVADNWSLIGDDTHVLFPGNATDPKSLQRISLRKSTNISGAIYHKLNTTARQTIFSDGSKLSDWDCSNTGKYTVCLRPDLKK